MKKRRLIAEAAKQGLLPSTENLSDSRAVTTKKIQILVRRRYLEFIENLNSMNDKDNKAPMEPFTKQSFNFSKLYLNNI